VFSGFGDQIFVICEALYAVRKFLDIPSTIPSAFTSVFLPLPCPSITVLQRELSLLDRVCDVALPSVLDENA
jgi:hypothetical protein